MRDDADLAERRARARLPDDRGGDAVGVDIGLPAATAGVAIDVTPAVSPYVDASTLATSCCAKIGAATFCRSWNTASAIASLTGPGTGAAADAPARLPKLYATIVSMAAAATLGGVHEKNVSSR